MSALLYLLAAAAEIAGCYCAWLWLRLDRSPLWLVPGMLLLAAFAVLLTRVPAGAAGRAFAAYGGVYICASLAWMWAVEGRRPDWGDMAGATMCIAGAVVIMLAPHRA